MADSITPHVDTKTPDGVERLVGQMIDESEAYISRQVRQDRIDASDVYKGRPYGNEEEGRSQVVLKIVRRVVARIMPSLMRIFTGPERYVEFKPRGPNGEEKAKQATDYVNYIVTEDNPGYSIIQAALKDALVRRVGVIKWGSEVKAIPETARYTGLSETELLSLWLDDDVTVEDIQPEEDEKGEYDEVPPTETNEQGETEPAGETAEPGADTTASTPPPSTPATPPGAPAAGPGPAPAAASPQVPASATKTFSALVTKGHTERRVWIRECPGEEILWDRDARDFESARIVDHVRFDMPVYELEAMGWDYEKDLIDNVGMGPMNLAANTAMMESDSRRNDMGILRTELLQDPHTRPIRYDEAYVRINYKNKGVKLHKVCMVGVAHHILGEPEPVSHVPFCRLTPDPEPHTLEGTSITDDVGPIQKIETQIARGVLDSLALTLSPALLIQDGEVNVKDLLNTEVGRFVRTTNPQTAVQELTHSFVGKEALPVMAYFDHEVENVTGQSDASQGLDADVLQSTTKLAVAGTFKAAQEQTEMIARTFAEQLKVLYKGLLRTIIENNDGPRIVRLRGKYIEIDPRAWDADMDVIVNVGLGQGLVEDRMNLLIQVAAKQEQIMATLGPNNPLVKLSQYRNTLARIIEMAGFKNAAEFFSEIDPQQEQAAEQAAAQAPQQGQDPNAALAAAEVQKAQIAAQADGQRAQLASQDKGADRQVEMFKVQHDAEMDRMRLAADIALKTREIEMKHGGAIDREQLRAEVEKEKALLDAKTKLTVESMKSEVARAGHASQEAVAAHAAGASVATAAIAQQGAVQKAIMQREARTIGTNVQKEANGPMNGEGA